MRNYIKKLALKVRKKALKVWKICQPKKKTFIVAFQSKSKDFEEKQQSTTRINYFLLGIATAFSIFLFLPGKFAYAEDLISLEKNFTTLIKDSSAKQLPPTDRPNFVLIDSPKKTPKPIFVPGIFNGVFGGIAAVLGVPSSFVAGVVVGGVLIYAYLYFDFKKKKRLFQ